MGWGGVRSQHELGASWRSTGPGQLASPPLVGCVAWWSGVNWAVPLVSSRCSSKQVGKPDTQAGSGRIFMVWKERRSHWEYTSFQSPRELEWVSAEVEGGAAQAHSCPPRHISCPLPPPRPLPALCPAALGLPALPWALPWVFLLTVDPSGCLPLPFSWGCVWNK